MNSRFQGAPEMKKIMKVLGYFVIFLLLVMALLPSLLIKSLDLIQPDSIGPINQAELCEVIGKGVNVDPECPQRRLDDILYEAFPKGEATREEVHEVLGAYFYSSDGRKDRYAIKRGWLFGPELAIFVFDQDDILMHILWQS